MEPVDLGQVPQNQGNIPQRQEKKPEVVKKTEAATSSKLSDFRAKKKSDVNMFYATEDELSKSSFRNTLNSIKNSVIDFFHSPSRTLSFMGFSREVKKDALLEKLEKKGVKSEKSLKTHIAKIEAEIKNTMADKSGLGIRRFVRLHYLEKELEVWKGQGKTLDKIIANEKRGNEVRKQLEVLGGERITIKTPDHVKLDGMYLDAKKFRQTLKEAGGKLNSYEISMNGHNKTIQGISLSEEMWLTSGNKVLNALEKLNALAGLSNLGAGWAVVNAGEDVLLVRSENVTSSSFQYDEFQKMWTPQIPLIAVKSEDLDDTKEASGTVILTSGNLGIYETSKEDALSFLFKGMNVVLFNFRGYGKSEGVPTKKGLKIDMESAYQLAKERSGHEDNKILFKALCMSGGPAAYVAAKHDKTNIFLDQSYASFRDLAKENVKDQIRKFILAVEKESDASMIRKIAAEFAAATFGSIINLFVNFVTPDYNTAKYLSKNRGQKAIAFVDNDEIISFKHVERNLQAISNVGEMKNTTLFAMKGEHGVSLLEIQSSPLDHVSKMHKGKKDETQESLNKWISKKEVKDTDISKIESTIALLSKALNEAQQIIDNVTEELKLLETNAKTDLNKKKNLEHKKMKTEREIQSFKQESIEAKKKIIILRDELKKIDDEIIQLIPADADIEKLLKKEKTAMNQMSHFLRKNGLSDDLIREEIIDEDHFIEVDLSDDFTK